jgi:MarR family transcriptional regulator, organic hydroperoxide resistance regulator
MDSTIASPVGTSPPPSSRYGACLLFAANALARTLTAIGEAEFSKMGLSYSHAYLLSELALNPGQTPSMLSETLFLSPSTITRLIEKLETRGLAYRQSEGKNTLVFPTQKGTELAPAVGEAWQTNWHKFADRLGEKEALELTRMIFAAAERLGAEEEGM